MLCVNVVTSRNAAVSNLRKLAHQLLGRCLLEFVLLEYGVFFKFLKGQMVYFDLNCNH